MLSCSPGGLVWFGCGCVPFFLHFAGIVVSYSFHLSSTSSPASPGFRSGLLFCLSACASFSSPLVIHFFLFVAVIRIAGQDPVALDCKEGTLLRSGVLLTRSVITSRAVLGSEGPIQRCKVIICVIFVFTWAVSQFKYMLAGLVFLAFLILYSFSDNVFLFLHFFRDETHLPSTNPQCAFPMATILNTYYAHILEQLMNTNMLRVIRVCRIN